MTPSDDSAAPRRDSFAGVVERHPWLFVIFSDLAISLGASWTMKLARAVGADRLERYAAHAFATVLLTILLAWALRWQREAGLTTRPSFGASVRLCWFPALFAALTLTSLALAAPPGLLRLIFPSYIALCAGLSEEAWRGLACRAMRGVGRYKSVLFTSFVFALPHVANPLQLYRVGGISSSDLLYLFEVFAFGAVFAALILRLGSIWPGVVIHALYDFGIFADPEWKRPRTAVAFTGYDAETQMRLLPIVVIFDLLLIYALFLIRPRAFHSPAAPPQASEPVVGPS